MGIGIVLGVVLVLYFAASYYLYTQASTLVYEYARSKDFSVSLPTQESFYTLTGGERIRMLRITNTSSPYTILYLHGTWGPLKDIFEKLANYATVVSISYPGYTSSTGISNTTNINEAAQKAVELLTAEGVSMDHLVVVGHSLGGSPALYLASQYPNMKAVITINTFFSLQKMCERQYGPLCIFGGSIHPSYQYARQNKASVLQVHSIEDEFIPYEQGKELSTQIAGTHSFVDSTGTHGGPNIDEVMTAIRKLPGYETFLKQ